MMACSLAKLIASKSFRPVAITSCRFHSLKHVGRRTSEIRDLFNEANCPRLSATRNLARLLNLMDNRIGVTQAACPRWDVMEDAKALYLIRDMSGLPNKDFVEPFSCAFPHLKGFGCTRVNSARAIIWLTVGLEGLDPGAAYPGYHIDIHTPNKIYHDARDMVMDVKNEILKITIPKKKGKWIRNIITKKARIYWPPKCIDDINRMLQTL